MFSLLLLTTVSSEYIAGCNQVSCDARSTNVAGLPAPSTPPALLFSLPPPHPTAVSSPGCLSNLRTIFCATYASQDSTTWTGGSILNSTGSLLFSATSNSTPSLRWCLQDSSFSAQGTQLGIMSTAGDLVAWSPSCIARMSSTGLTAWQSPLSPASPCSSLSTGISSIGLASPSTLTFYRESGQIFSFYPSGTPDASLSLRANSSSSNSSASALPSASGFLLPLALTTDGAQRTLYLTRFYKCSDSHNAACTGLPSAAPSQQLPDPTPTLLPTAEIRLVAMDSRTGTPTDPRRMELPWANLGPRIAGQPLDACALPSGRELLHAAATVLPGGSTLVAAFACLQDSLTGAPGPLFLAAFDVHGNASEPRPLWSTSTGSLAAQPGGQPPAMVQHPSAPQLLYIAGAGAGSSGAQVVTVNASTGQVLAVAGLAEAVRQLAAGAACPLSLLLQGEEGSSYVLQLTAPPKALPPPAPSLLLSVTATTPGTGANATAWLVALALEEAAPLGAALLPVRWCVALPEGGFQGQFVAATAALGSGSSSGSAPQPEHTVLVGVAASGAISGFSWPAAAG